MTQSTQPAIPQEKIIKLPQVEQITGLSRASIYKRIKSGVFPKQIKLGLRASGWVESEVYGYVNSLIQANRTPSGNDKKTANPI
jgi:prophage regulatory protein